MAIPNMAQLVAEAFERELRETPSAWGDLLFDVLGGPRKTYRERLDEQPRNVYGELIPRIVTVRRNLWRLKLGY